MGTIWSKTLISCLAVCTGLAACHHGSPAAPTTDPLVGVWASALTDRAPCVGDWSSFSMTLRSPGSGEIVTKDRAHFAAVEVVENGVRRIDVSLPAGPGECQSISFVVSNIEHDANGRATAFSGEATGRCCGTIVVPYRMARSG